MRKMSTLSYYGPKWENIEKSKMKRPGTPRVLDNVHTVKGSHLVDSLTVTCANLRILTFLTIFRHFGVEKWSKYGQKWLKMAIFGDFWNYGILQMTVRSITGLTVQIKRSKRGRYHTEVVALGHSEAVGTITAYYPSSFKVIAAQISKFD